MSNEELNQQKSFLATLMMGNTHVSFSYVTTEDSHQSLDQDISESYGYVQAHHEFLCLNTFEDMPIRLYFRHIGDGYNEVYVRSAVEPGKQLGINNKGYVWVTSEPHRSHFFALMGEDKKTILSIEDLPDESRVYIKGSRNGQLLTSYNESKVGDKHFWSYLTDEGGPDALFTLKVLERNAGFLSQ
ncbi:hypothetical protein ACUHMQ_19675 [Chitinimonas sp. PSY-7]|uniref:hypothetical protein n=1 Tax=Chitinimonas sp. PSY-7 TaxID=3459088 RepID=UPI00403FF03E